MTITTKTFLLFVIAGSTHLDTPAQKPQQESLLQTFNAYREQGVQEKIFLHSDKDFYLAGEICWFKLYNVDAFFHHPIGISKVAYVELLDKTNNPVLQVKISMKEGDGNGSFQLPLTLVSGKYKIRAYTNWMKNFSPEYYFENIITIINSRQLHDGAAPPSKEGYDIQFFPEGGNLVNGIQSKIAFRVVDANGKGITCEGAVINQKTDTIVKYATQRFGVGSFVLNPLEGHSYKTVISLPGGEKMARELPRAYKNGYVMHLEAVSGKSTVSVVIHTNNKSASGVYLFAHTRGSVKVVLSGTIRDGSVSFLVDKSKLGDGITHFTVFDAEKHPVCERLFFKYPEKKLHVEMATDSQQYEVRKKMNIHILTTDQEGKPEKANMSMAVYRLDTLQGIDETDINNYLWLTSDLVGTIESPAYYFNNQGSDVEAAMDNLMLTQGWRRFLWDDILQNKKPAFRFVPEYAGHIVTGKITQTGTRSPAKNIAAYLAVAGARTQMHSALSAQDGGVSFDINNFYNEGEIIVQTDNLQDSLFSIEISSPFSANYSGTRLPAFTLPQANGEHLLHHHMSVEVQSAYNKSRFNQFRLPDIDTAPFYLHPDATYMLDDYVRFTTMEEVISEYVREVNISRKNGKFRLTTLNIPGKSFFLTPPLVLLDGVPVFDINKLMNEDPLKIRKLEVVGKKYYLENMFFDGIINFVSYSGNLKDHELDPQATVIDYDGLQFQRAFFSPVYEIQQQLDSRLPDFRDLLYWSPEINTGANGQQDVSFYTSDRPGVYAIILQGITANGRTASKAIRFQVIKRLDMIQK